jgi:hypothetical protein
MGVKTKMVDSVFKFLFDQYAENRPSIHSSIIQTNGNPVDIEHVRGLHNVVCELFGIQN